MPFRTSVVLADRYELGTQLGRGGMASVFAATDLVLDRPVAVKILAPPYDRDREFISRFRREAQAAARLNHPNIVAVFDTGSDGGRQFIVTELVRGQTLAEVMSREGRLPPARAVEIGREVAQALGAAHAAGIVHRDVKPSNVMLEADGSAKVLDFGIAQAAGEESITRSGWVLGSASYLSPEQARGERADERTDIYGLGCALYAMLAGRPPFVAESAVATMFLHVHERPEPPSSFAPEVPSELDAIVLRCLAKDRDARFASATALEAALDEAAPERTRTMPIATGEAAAEPAPTAPVSRVATANRTARSRGILAIAVVAAVVGLGALAVAALDDPGPVVAARDRATGPESSAASSPSPSAPSPTSSDPRVPLGVEPAFAALLDTIDAASLGGDIPEEHDAEKLRQGVLKIADRYQQGSADGVAKEAAKLQEELDRLTDDGRLSLDAGEEIRAALDGVLAAIDADPPLSSDGDGDGDGDGGDD